MSEKHTLDPLWITKGMEGFDPEYYKYIMLAANKKWREKLDAGDSSSFYEILFHSLNLNNLAVEGSILDFNMNPVWDVPKLKEIRNHLRKLYQLPDNLVEIFKNSNYLLTKLLIDYLEVMLEPSEDVKTFFVNKTIQKQKEIFLILNLKSTRDYSIWRLKFDKRFKYGHKIEKVDDISLEEIKENAIHDAIVELENPKLSNINPDKNVLFLITEDEVDECGIIQTTAFSLIFNRGIAKDHAFQPNILEELYDILYHERVIPFTLKGWK